MEQSIFKALVDQYQTPHPFLGVDGQAFPMIPYSMKLELIQNAGASQGLTMDDFINAETRRVKQLLDAANERGDTQLATRVLNELYPLMVEDVQSGNPTAVQVYSPVVNQMRYIIGVTQQPQTVVQAEEPAPQPEPTILRGDERVDDGFAGAEPVDPEPQTSFAEDDGRVDVEPVDVEPVDAGFVEAESVAPIAEDVEPVDAGFVDDEPQLSVAEDEGRVEVASVGTGPIEAESIDVDPADAKPEVPIAKDDNPADAEPKSVPVGKRAKKRTPTSSIILYILGAAFVLAFLLINALPFIGIGTYEEFLMTGLLGIAIMCLVLGLVCAVIGLIIAWRSRAKRRMG